MSGSNSTVQRQLEERILSTLGISHGKVAINDTSFDFDGLAGDAVYEIYAGIERLRPGQQQKISQDILKMVLYEKMLGKPVRKVIVVVDKAIANSLSYEKHRSWKNRAIVEYGVEVRVFPISPEDRLMLEKAKEEQGRKFKNPI